VFRIVNIAGMAGPAGTLQNLSALRKIAQFRQVSVRLLFGGSCSNFGDLGSLAMLLERLIKLVTYGSVRACGGHSLDLVGFASFRC